jgi:hypothetical protein
MSLTNKFLFRNPQSQIRYKKSLIHQFTIKQMAHHHDEEFRLQGGEFDELNRKYDRRRFLTKTSLGLGALALGGLWAGTELFASTKKPNTTSLEADVLAALPHFAPKAKRVVYLFMSGGLRSLKPLITNPNYTICLGKTCPIRCEKPTFDGHECQPKPFSDCSFFVQIQCTWTKQYHDFGIVAPYSQSRR